MTTKAQNAWAWCLEKATQREIRQMAEWAAEHLDDPEEVAELRRQIDAHHWSLTEETGKSK